MNPQLLNQTRILVEKYDESLKVIASLSAENQSLRVVIENEKAKASTLIEHYQDQICEQTSRLTELKESIRARDIAGIDDKQKRKVHDDSISTKLREARAKEVALLGRIQVLEEEVERLKCIQTQQREDSERKHLADQVTMKESFQKQLECLRQKLVSNMYEEMGDVLAKTMQINDKLSDQLKTVLAELESMQISRNEKEKELSFAKREIKLLKYREKMMAQRNAGAALLHLSKTHTGAGGAAHAHAHAHAMEETRDNTS
jgi:chromosome segregation ATPase